AGGLSQTSPRTPPVVPAMTPGLRAKRNQLFSLTAAGAESGLYVLKISKAFSRWRATAAASEGVRSSSSPDLDPVSSVTAYLRASSSGGSSAVKVSTHGRSA